MSDIKNILYKPDYEPDEIKKARLELVEILKSTNGKPELIKRFEVDMEEEENARKRENRKQLIKDDMTREIEDDFYELISRDYNYELFNKLHGALLELECVINEIYGDYLNPVQDDD